MKNKSQANLKKRIEAKANAKTWVKIKNYSKKRLVSGEFGTIVSFKFITTDSIKRG